MTQTAYLHVETIMRGNDTSTLILKIEHDYPDAGKAVQAVMNAMRILMLLDPRVPWETFWLEVPEFLDGNTLTVPGIHSITHLPIEPVDNGELGFECWEDVEVWMVNDLTAEKRRELLGLLPASTLREWIVDDLSGDWATITDTDPERSDPPTETELSAAIDWLANKIVEIHA